MTRRLPPFPLDDLTLAHVEHALNTRRGDPAPDDAVTYVGGEFTLSALLDFLSGYDPDKSVLVSGDPDADYPGAPLGIGPETAVYMYPHALYSDHDLIRALVAEVRRLRALCGELGHPQAN